MVSKLVCVYIVVFVQIKAFFPNSRSFVAPLVCFKNARHLSDIQLLCSSSLIKGHRTVLLL